MAFADITDLTVEVAFATAPLATPTWTTLPDSDIRGVSIRRGRSSEFDTMQAGKCTIVLDNSTRKYDPLHTGSPYWPNVKPMRRVRVRMTYDGITYDLFHGFADGWPQSYSPPSDATVELSCTDGFKLLSRAELPESVWELAVRTDGPGHWWRFGEGDATVPAADSAGSDDGTYVVPATGVLTFGETGPVNNDADTAVLLDYATTATNPEPPYIEFPSRASVIGTGGFSIEFFYKYKGGTEGLMFYQHGPAVHAPGFSGYHWLVRAVGSAGTLSFDVDSPVDGTLGSRAETSGVSANIWNHVVAVRETDGTAKLYVNGTLRATGPTRAPLELTYGTLAVKVEPSDGGAYWLDEAVVYNTPLSASRVATHYEAATTAWGDHDSDQRVTALLDAALWPSADRNLGDGRSTLQRATLGGSVLEQLQAVDLTENGRLFVAKDGKVRFIGRHDLLKPPYTTSKGIVGDAPGELPYTPNLHYDYDDELVKARVRISSQGQSTQVAEDAAALSAYGPLTLERSATLYDNAGEMRDMADYLLTQYKEPLLRASVVEIVPMADPANLLPQVLGNELADRITLRTRPQNVGSMISQDQLIEGIKLDITPGNMTCHWDVSPADTKAYWVLGTSALGTGTRLAA